MEMTPVDTFTNSPRVKTHCTASRAFGSPLTQLLHHLSCAPASVNAPASALAGPQRSLSCKAFCRD